MKIRRPLATISQRRPKVRQSEQTNWRMQPNVRARRANFLCARNSEKSPLFNSRANSQLSMRASVQWPQWLCACWLGVPIWGRAMRGAARPKGGKERRAHTFSWLTRIEVAPRAPWPPRPLQRRPNWNYTWSGRYTIEPKMSPGRSTVRLR